MDHEYEQLQAENAQLKEELAQAMLNQQREIEKLTAEARENYDFLIQSRDFILNEFCQLQINYGQQKHEIRKLKAELAQCQQERRGSLEQPHTLRSVPATTSAGTPPTDQPREERETQP